jgi:hypothetical protein
MFPLPVKQGYDGYKQAEDRGISVGHRVVKRVAPD